MKKKLKALVLFDGASPTTIDQDFSKEMKTEDWKTEANVMKALKELGYDDNAVTRALDALAPRTNHKDQIRRILTRLGFEPDGDIANLSGTRRGHCGACLG